MPVYFRSGAGRGDKVLGTRLANTYIDLKPTQTGENENQPTKPQMTSTTSIKRLKHRFSTKIQDFSKDSKLLKTALKESNRILCYRTALYCIVTVLYILFAGPHWKTLNNAIWGALGPLTTLSLKWGPFMAINWLQNLLIANNELLDPVQFFRSLATAHTFEAVVVSNNHIMWKFEESRRKLKKNQPCVTKVVEYGSLAVRRFCGVFKLHQ